MSHPPSTRSLSAGDQLQKDLTQLIQQELRDPRITAQDKLALNITEVKVSRDFSVADVRISFMQLPGIDSDTIGDKRSLILEILRGASGFLRSRIARASTLRSIPDLKFHYDESVEQGIRVAALLAAERTKQDR